ncbi:dedicator of cytokinesis protein myoblast city isoform X3 [Bombus vancouverensis nearcticus]|uniref:Dedicator of cytokinesis protein 1 isoform X3 n=1 Tax=Bombus bifarius TaxID=103933 RepID=A0A6P8MCY5_9HYME|nr:dedicator of cytokinesis protein 1 isoform X3 [Bombus vancouverensis nearcticus]XP_033300490.1 dedicator of cytokinesis protein 1 isoform X3 [Bombus bifarius]
MTMAWKQVKEHLGVAIHNFVHGTPYAMQLTVGEMVQILEEYGDWYYGRSKFKGTCGIFPKSYIHILQQSVNMDCLIHEITNVLREWGHHWKHLYVIHSMHFRTMQQQILELIGYRSKILSGTLTVDELKDVKRLATARIDTGNQLLGMDMVVRDDQGNVLSPEETSTIQLYYHHETAAERIRKAANDTKHKPSKPQAPVYSHIFFISVRNFVCKMAEDVELLLTLYDGREMKTITENYVVSWSKEGLARDIDQLHNLRVLFTDLGSRDLTRDKVYLVCYVIRVGGMEAKDADHRRSSVAQTNQKVKNTENMRRPFGVAAMDITLYITGKLEGDSDHHHFIPFVQCCEKESLDGTLRRILSQKEINIQKSSNGNSGSSAGGQGLWASLKLLRGDPKQVRDENPHLVLGNVAIARKMGFPEVILPGDVRNDLYLTLISGEFNKGSKSTDKNVEVTVKVCNEFGVPIPGVMTLGGGASPIDEYHSVIYYHEDKPRWCETFKIAIPIEEFKQAHLKFTFKHRSSNEAKDKSEKPFALSYVKLMQRNGTTLQDIQHELLVYKLDQKKYEEIDISYLKLPSTRGELVELSLEKKPTLGTLTLSSKDSFLIATNICSTKLTQNVDLLGLLNWASHNTNLRESLIALMKVDGEEVVKFLQDVLDALFNILMSNSDSDVYDDMVFECLLYIIGLVSDRKYQHFQPVMDLYISESFSATLAYKKLISVLRKRIDNATNNDGQERDILLKTMKSLQYCMRFVVESRLLFTALNQDEEEFSQTLTELLRSIVELMRHETDSTLLVQGACLKYLPTTIPHLLRVYSGKQLSTILTDLLVTLPVGRLTKQKMMTVNDIVHSPLFLSAECRAILLPRITILVRDLLEAKEEVELCVKILSDILELTFRKDIGSTIQDVKEIMLTALRTIIQTVISMDRENPLVGNLVSVMLAIFRQMTQHHYEIYINHFGTKFDLLDFLMEILLVFKDLVSKSVFPGDWCEMIMLQNSIILKSLRYFSGTIRDYFFTDFEQQAWSNFFHCAIAFLTQPALQLETFTPSKRNRIVLRYNDMRRETAFEIRSMWFNLGQHKILFVPGLVGAILEMALIPETELRKATIPIFFDMMQCEFYSSRIVEGYGDTKRDPAHIKANFTEYENEMIAKLDILVEGGRGDEQFHLLWIQVMGNLCEKHSTMREQGLRFVDTVAKLMERLLQYRDVIHAESQEHRMLCIVNLLEFYSEINRKEMYIRYVNKLCELHLECDNYTEAAYSLKLHSQLLAWSDQPLPPLLRSHRYLACQTHRELKEALYNDMIEYFDKGKMWECALAVCKELVTQYEEETFDYLQLSVLLTRMAKFYDSIVKQLRPEPEYFRVAYYGRGHPAFLQNKVFIYRGKEYERLSDFCSRTLNQLPNAEQMNKLSPPTSEMLESNHQYVQINRVDPLMDEKRHRLSGKPITAEAVLRYHRVNDVQRFRFSRPAPKKDLTSTTANSGDKETNTVTNNEFASLWLERTVLVTSHPLPGILRCFPVTSSETYLVSPLRNAIETMEATNTTLRDLILAHRADNNIPLNPLSMKLNGILDPAVMGGIDNYEKAFLNSEYRSAHPEESSDLLKLEGLIAEQIPLLSVGVQLHKARAPPELTPFHQRLEQCFTSMRNQVEAKYGKRTCDLQIESLTQPVMMRRHQSSRGENNRLSESHIMNSDCGTHSRVSSLTRSQVATFKSLASFNFNNSTPSSGTQNVSLSRNCSIRSHILSTASLQKALGSPSPGTNKKKDSKRRSSRKSDSVASTKSDQPTSQWYTTADVPQITSSPVTPLMSSFPTTPIFELRQELTPKRPLRSEVEKERRISNRLSGQSQHYLRNINNGMDSSSLGKGNRDSIGTTDSTASEDDPPPPLPMKTREADYCNLPEELPVQHCGTGSLNNFNRSLGQWSKNKLPTPTDDLDIQTKPPTPPPKPKRPPYSLNKLILSSDIDNFSQDPSVT